MTGGGDALLRMTGGDALLRMNAPEGLMSPCREPSLPGGHSIGMDMLSREGLKGSLSEGGKASEEEFHSF